MAVEITLVARYEWLDDVQAPSWWADSPQAPGFFAAASSLGELQREAEAAIRWAHQGEDLDVTWGYQDIPLGATAAISHLNALATTGMLSSGQRIVSQTVVVYGFENDGHPGVPDPRSQNPSLVR